MNQKESNEPTRETWKALYEAAARFFALKPWTWLLDSDVFGVKNPANGEIGYCCIMGAAEEHYALAVYLGSEGLDILKRIGLQEAPTDPLSVLVSQKCLMASFEDREMMEPADLKTIRELGLKFRGRNAWPQFRSYLPGYAPWTLNQDQAEFLTVALNQACEVAPRFKEVPEQLATQNALNAYERFLVRVSRVEGGKQIWEDAMLPVEPYQPSLLLPSPPDIKRLQRIAAKAQRTDGVLDMDYFYVPTPVKEDTDERPWYPQIILCVDDDSGMILHMDMGRPAEIGRKFGEALLNIVERSNQLPAAVQVRSEQTQILLEPIVSALEIDLALVDSLPLIQEAQQGLIESI
jgi:hypothetical protein